MQLTLIQYLDNIWNRTNAQQRTSPGHEISPKLGTGRQHVTERSAARSRPDRLGDGFGQQRPALLHLGIQDGTDLRGDGRRIDRGMGIVGYGQQSDFAGTAI